MGLTLSREDSLYLDSISDDWHIESCAKEQGIVINKFSLPDGYKQSSVKLMVLISRNYPLSALTMFYVSPEIVRIDYKEIIAVSNETHFNKQWQRWSRHYQWKPEAHSIATHICFIANALKYELVERFVKEACIEKESTQMIKMKERITKFVNNADVRYIVIVGVIVGSVIAGFIAILAARLLYSG